MPSLKGEKLFNSFKTIIQQRVRIHPPTVSVKIFITLENYELFLELEYGYGKMTN
jgi:hypothetical protein